MKKLIMITAMFMAMNTWSADFMYCMSPSFEDVGTTQIQLWKLATCVRSQMELGYEPYGDTFKSFTEEEVQYGNIYLQAMYKR